MAVPPGRQAQAEQFYKDRGPGDSHMPSDPMGVQAKGKEKMSLMVMLNSEREPWGSKPQVLTRTLQGGHTSLMFRRSECPMLDS